MRKYRYYCIKIVSIIYKFVLKFGILMNLLRITPKCFNLHKFLLLQVSEDNKSTIIPKWSISNPKGLSTLSWGKRQKRKFFLMFTKHWMPVSVTAIQHSFALCTVENCHNISIEIVWASTFAQCESPLISLFLQGSSWGKNFFVLYLRIRRVPRRRGACRLRTGDSGSCSLGSCRYCTWRWDSGVWRSRFSVCSSHCKYFARSRTKTTN